MRIFVTGATGYVGSALCRRLLAAGHQVAALVRPTSHTQALVEAGVACYEGDVTDRYSMREGMSGADWVIHAAAELDFAAPLERMRRVNVEGSRNAASLAYKLGVGRFLSISSVARFGGSPADGGAASEATAPQLPLPSNYSRTKHDGELAIQAEAERGLKVNTVFPSLVYGPPGKKQGANAILRSVLRGRLPAIVAGDRKTSWIFLDDLVDGILRVIERAAPGRHYLLAGDVATVRSVVEQVAALGGVSAPRWRLAVGPARLAAAVATPLYRLRGYRPPLSAGQLRSLARHWNFDDSRARRELDWRPRTLVEGLPPTVEHLARS